MMSRRVRFLQAILLPLLVGGLLLCGCGKVSESPEKEKVNRIPQFNRIKSVKKKKKLFFNYLRPVIKEENARILRQRTRLMALHEEHQTKGILTWTDMKWLESLLKEYRLAGSTGGEISTWGRLLRRVDMVPPELALVQAAKESGWGTSRFAREGNNFFGQRCFVKGCGIVPEGRPPGEVFEVAKFDSPSDSVRSYISNLNTNVAYRKFRQLRFKQRREGKLPNAYSLVDGLPNYSERREVYLHELRSMIRGNRSFFGS